MNETNWDRAFTHKVQIRNFRVQMGDSPVYLEIIDRLVRAGGSFAVSQGYLWLSEYSSAVYASAVEELTTGSNTHRLVAQRRQERE